MIYRDVQASCLRFCSNFSAAHPTLVVENFDAHGDESTLPPQDIIGLSSLSISVDNKMVSISLMFGISTLVDTNLFRITELIDTLLNELLPTKQIPLLDADTGIQNGYLAIQNGTRVLSVGGSAARPLQYIMVNLLASYGY